MRGVMMVHAPTAFADQCQGPQVGTWTLLSYEMIVSVHRAVPASVVPTDAEKITLFEGLIAFSGRYTVDGGRFTYCPGRSSDIVRT